MPRLYTLGDFHKLALSVSNKECRRQLLAMHKQFRSRHGCSTTHTPILPKNISNMFARSGKALNACDVRSQANLFTFVKWYGQNDIIRQLSQKDLGQWLDLCVHTLAHIYSFCRAPDRKVIRKWFLLHLRGECSVFTHRTQLCVQHALMCGKTSLDRISDTVFTEMADFVDCVVGVDKHQQQWLKTSLSFRDAPKMNDLCDWSRQLVHSLFGQKTTLVLVILFGQHVQVFRDEGQEALVAIIIRTKNDNTCNSAIVNKLESYNLLETDRAPFYLNVMLSKQHGLYVV